MHPVSRRHFLTRSSSVALGFAGLSASLARGSTASLLERLSEAGGTDPTIGFGPLIDDPAGIIALPEGFSYRVFSRTGETMDDGLSVPGKHDAMGAFPYIRADGSVDPDRTIIIRNHEVEDAHRTTGAFVRPGSIDTFDQAKLYDPGFGRPSRGGTTTLVYNTKTRELESQWMSLAGTERNCAGGVTPHNTWLTCEETASVKGERFEQDHGYVFEVPVTATPTLAEPKPIRAMGRFMHEATSTDPRTGIVYQTEDRHDGIIYRYIPKEPDDLHAGGKLQALRVDHTPSLDTRNWDAETVRPNEPMTVSWITLNDVESPKDDLRYRGFQAGAARFARGEGMWWGDGSVYFAATTGGQGYHGQLWRITADPDSGVDRLELFAEPRDPSILHRADNITFSPWGHLIVCEDENEPPRMIGVTPEGQFYVIGRNAASNSEFAGATFSADGKTLFVNIQNPGYTLEITGPWDRITSG
jgi:secreted PhoX family phosphatase